MDHGRSRDSLIDKLLENQYQQMFNTFDVDKLDPPSLTIEQFEKYVYAIGMNFIVQHYKSGRGELFETEENPTKSRVTFPEFIDYLNIQSEFDHSDAEFKQKMDIFDMDGNGEEASVEDLRRVLKQYSLNMSEDQVEHFIQLNIGTNEHKLMEILKRISKTDMQMDVRGMLGDKALSNPSLDNPNDDEQEDNGPKTVNIEKSVQKMFNHVLR